VPPRNGVVHGYLTAAEGMREKLEFFGRDYSKLVHHHTRRKGQKKIRAAVTIDICDRGDGQWKCCGQMAQTSLRVIDGDDANQRDAP
jgi:hypothetical protein